MHTNRGPCAWITGSEPGDDGKGRMAGSEPGHDGRGAHPASLSDAILARRGGMC